MQGFRADFELEWNWTKIEIRNNARVTQLTNLLNDGSHVQTQNMSSADMKEKGGSGNDHTATI